MILRNALRQQVLFSSEVQSFAWFPSKSFIPRRCSIVSRSYQIIKAMSPVKRKAATTPSAKSKKAKIELPDYHLTPSRRDEAGEIVWPAPKGQIQRAREIILECAKSNKPTVILPDKDADGLSSGAILHHTLTTLGLSPSLISVYFPPKGTTIHNDTTRDALSALSPSYIFVLDQGSRKSPPLVNTTTSTGATHTSLVIDHHFASEDGFPEGAEYVTAHDCPPVATSSLLTYHICGDLHDEIPQKTAWLAILGTHGDLGAQVKWQPPFPDMSSTFKLVSKSQINKAVPLINAPRRTAAYNVSAAWDLLLAADGPEPILKSEELEDAQAEIASEVKNWSHTAPKFSADATVALLEINSKSQIHPLIATRWAGFLSSKKMEIVMCANVGYLPGKVNFSCRVAKSAKGREGDDKVDIIKKLEGFVKDMPELRERMGDNFARGHKEASGGVVGVEEWEEFRNKAMRVGESTGRKKAEGDSSGSGSEKVGKSPQKNTLANYFKPTKKELKKDDLTKDLKKGVLTEDLTKKEGLAKDLTEKN